MLKKNFFLLAILVIWFGMTIRALFWWNSDNTQNNVQIQDEQPWFIEEITNTTGDNTDSNNIITQTPTQTWDWEKKDYIEVKVMMPKYFYYNTERKKFAENLYNSGKIYMNFILIDDLNSYRDQLINNYSNADLFLFPYDWKDIVPTKSLLIGESVEQFFDPLVSQIVKWNQISFLPFAADPMVMYAVSWYSSQNNFSTIYDFAFDRESKIPLSFPLFFWINSEDLKEWFAREYQDIVRYALMHYFTIHNDSKSLQTWVDINVTQTYNISNLNTISDAITAPECKYFPSLCMQLYKFVWLRFGFLSDADIVNTYFSWKKASFDNLSRITTPFFQLESPVRIRWRWISQSTEDTDIINGIYKIFEQYIKWYNKYYLRNSTLSVFKWVYEWLWLLDNKYIWLRWYILTTWWDYIKTLRNINKFRDLISYHMTAKDYLR